MADTPWDGFSDVAYLQATDILVGQRGAGGINFTADALLFKDANGRVGLGVTAEDKAKLIIQGTDQDTGALTDAGSHGASLFLRATGVGPGSGGALLFGSTFGNQRPFAALKGYVVDGGTNSVGDLIVSLRNAVADTALTSRVWFKQNGRVGVGTSGPAYGVDVVGGVRALGGAVTAGDCGFRFGTGGDTDGGIFSSADGQVEIACNNANAMVVTNTVIRPAADNASAGGGASFRYTVLYAVSGTINTSDEREKLWIEWSEDRRTVDRRVARRILDELGWYQWRDAVAEKGEDGARWHFGARAQRVWSIVADEGLCAPLIPNKAMDMIPDPAWEGAAPPAWLCYDIWEDKFEPELVKQTRIERTPVCIPYEGLFDAKGQPAVRWEHEEEEVEEWVETGEMLLVRPAGNRFGFRIDQLGLLLDWSLHDRLTTLEAKAA